MEQPRFTPPFTALNDDTTSDEHRRALRRSVKMRAHLRDRGQTRFEIEVVDLSQAGFRAHTSFTLWPGTVVWLTLPGMAPLEAVVAWRDKATYGCAFARPLHSAVFEHIVGLGR